MTAFLQQLVNGIALGSVYALLALGVTLVWGVLNVLNFAHAQFITWGAFGTWWALGRGLPTVVAVIVGIAVGAALAVLLQLTVIGALQRRSTSDEFSFVVATIGVGLLLETVVKILSGPQIQPFPPDAFPTGTIKLGAVELPSLQLVVLIATVVIMVVLGLWLRRTRLGRELRAVAYSREIAQLLGVNTRTVFVTAFAVSGGLAALAGTFVAAQTATVSYSSGSALLTLTFAAVVVGGMGSIPGALAGGLLLGLGQVLLGSYVSSALGEGFAYLLMAVVLVARPTGLFGQQAVSRA
jgi:branched-chain amino acid transport system permease protein